MDNQDQNQADVQDVAPLKVTINGQEYDPTEAQSLIDKGRQTSEYEQKWNTSLDKVWPEYGRSQQTIKQLETERNEARAQLSEFQQKQQAGTETQSDVNEAREAAKKLGLAFNEDLEKSGFIKKEQLPELFQSYMSEQKAIEGILSKADSLEKEIDGSDGRPKFNKKAVLAYASAYQIDDLQAAYEDMHGGLKEWKDAQIAANQKPSLKTLKGSGGAKQPTAVKVTENNVNDLLRESLFGNKE